MEKVGFHYAFILLIFILYAQSTFGRFKNLKSISFNSHLFFSYRAIPEAGYITLGTLRYGVKLSKNPSSINYTHSRSSSYPTPKTERSLENHKNHRSLCDNDSSLINGMDKQVNKQINKRSDSDNSSSDVTSVNGSCCINATKISLPWIGKLDHGKLMGKLNKHYSSFEHFENSKNRKKNFILWVCQCM